MGKSLFSQIPLYVHSKDRPSPVKFENTKRKREDPKTYKKATHLNNNKNQCII